MVRAIAILCLGLFPLLSLPGTQAGWAFCLNNLDFCGMEAEADSCCKQASVDTCCGDHGAEDSTGCCLEANGGSVFVSGAALSVGPVALVELWRLDLPEWGKAGHSENYRLHRTGFEPPPPTTGERLQWLQVRLT